MSVLMFIQGSSASTKAEAALRPGGAMGSLMEDVVTCKKTLEEAASSEEQVIDALKLLSSTPVTKQLLTKTLIGKTVPEHRYRSCKARCLADK